MLGAGLLGSFLCAQPANTWIRVLPGTVANDVSAVAVDLANPQNLYVGRAGGGVLRSTDGAATWEGVGDGLPLHAAVSSVALDRFRLGVVYVGTQGVFKSEDAGQTWKALDLNNPQYGGGLFVALDPIDPNAVYAGASNGLLRSTDQGTSWSLLPGALRGHWVYCLAFGAAVPKTLFAGTDRGVFFSEDGGQTWAPSAAGPLSNSGISAFLVNSTLPSSVLAGTFNTVSIGPPGIGVFSSGDGAQSWSPSNNGFPQSSAASSFAASLASPSFVLGAASPGGVFLSVDAGGTWSPANQGLPPLFSAGALVADPSSPSSFYGALGFAGVDVGLYRISFSTNAGCQPTATVLCLNSSRFRVRVDWESPQGASGTGQALAITGDTGAFSFFDPANIEVVVKVLDGRTVNGKFWVFGGSLSNVAYAVTVTDTQTGASRIYFNQQGNLASFADTAAF